MTITSRDLRPGDTSPSLVGTVTEFNTVRDAPVAYHSASEHENASLIDLKEAFVRRLHQTCPPLPGGGERG